VVCTTVTEVDEGAVAAAAPAVTKESEVREAAASSFPQPPSSSAAPMEAEEGSEADDGLAEESYGGGSEYESYSGLWGSEDDGAGDPIRGGADEASGGAAASSRLHNGECCIGEPATDVVCLDEESLTARVEAEVREVCELTELPRPLAALLLRHFKWDKEQLFGRWFEDTEGVCREAGLAPAELREGGGVQLSQTRTFECSICRESGEQAGTALWCGHSYCNKCWAQYLEGKVEEGVTLIACPDPECKLRVPQDVVCALTSPAVGAKFSGWLRKSYVEDCNEMVWCPTAGCGLSVTTKGVDSQFLCCSGGHAFCSLCKNEAHAPASCECVKKWLEKCDDDSETFNWLSANTQDCPRCNSTIEKNGGCNHMTCRKCRFEFCWVCLQEWKTHTDFYSCNRYDAGKRQEKDSKKQASRAALDRYLFHYHRFINHGRSSKLEAETLRKAEEKMELLQAKNPSHLWGDVQFIGLSTSEAIRCRTVLKWTYVFAHDLEDETPAKNLFCFLQQDLEQKTERCSELLESDVEQLFKPDVRAELLALCSSAKNARRKLLEGVATGLSHTFEAAATDAAAAPPNEEQA